MPRVQTARASSPAGVDLDQLWYVPDRRLRTKGATETTLALADWISGRADRLSEPDEQELFMALHTCAYQALRVAREKPAARTRLNPWVRRWQLIREHIVERNLGLVYSMISRFSGKRIDEDDLLSDAMLGLTRAVDRFNPWKGYRFSTYACNVIARALMRRGKRDRHYRQLFPVQFDVTFERPVPGSDFQADLYVERLHRVLSGNLGELTDLESRILAKRFPNEQGARLTFQEIGETVGLSKERVRQIQNIALRKLRNVLDEDPVLQ